MSINALIDVLSTPTESPTRIINRDTEESMARLIINFDLTGINKFVSDLISLYNVGYVPSMAYSFLMGILINKIIRMAMKFGVDISVGEHPERINRHDIKSLIEDIYDYLSKAKPTASKIEKISKELAAEELDEKKE